MTQSAIRSRAILFSVWEAEMCLTSFINLSHHFDDTLWGKMGGASTNTPCLLGHFLLFPSGWSLSLSHLRDCAAHRHQLMWIFMDVTTHLTLLTSNLLHTCLITVIKYMLWKLPWNFLETTIVALLYDSCSLYFISCAWWHYEYTCGHMSCRLIDWAGNTNLIKVKLSQHTSEAGVPFFGQEDILQACWISVMMMKMFGWLR